MSWKRFDIPTTRRIVNAVQNGELDDVETQMLNGLNLEILYRFKELIATC